MTESDNPYAPVSVQPPHVMSDVGNITLKDLKKIEAIIKDARGFWLALVLCMLCTAIGLLIIGPWYLVRLLQWNAMAQAYPQLLEPNPAAGSLQARFRSSKWKLIVGLVGGVMVAAAVFGFIVFGGIA